MVKKFQKLLEFQSNLGHICPESKDRAADGEHAKVRATRNPGLYLCCETVFLFRHRGCLV
jgi:hypothetical protein